MGLWRARLPFRLSGARNGGRRAGRLEHPELERELLLELVSLHVERVRRLRELLFRERRWRWRLRRWLPHAWPLASAPRVLLALSLLLLLEFAVSPFFS